LIVHVHVVAGLLALGTALPLAWKWQLGVIRTAVVVGAFAVCSVMVVGAAAPAVGLGTWATVASIWILTIAGAFALLAFRFYRDPERCAPERSDVVVSPADGIVVYIRRSEAGLLPVANKNGRRFTLTELTKTRLSIGDAVVIGIAMNFADVHVNRAPIEGRVTLRRHFSGRFGSLRHPEMTFENERATTVIERDGLQVAVVQIASRLVRQIASFVSEGQPVALGQRLGVIRLGSQVDLVVPRRDDLRITTEVGERVRAGESVLAVVETKKSRGAVRADREGGAIVIGEHIRGLALVRSLGRRGIRVWTLEPVGERAASLSRFSRRSLPWPSGTDRELVDYLLGLAARHGLDGWPIFPSSDEATALLARHHAELSERFRLTVPDWSVLRWAYDKRLTYELAASERVDQPETFLPRNRDEVSTLDCRFPIILKPAYKKASNRFTRDKAWRVDDRASLVARYDEACTLVEADAILVQELIPGGGEAQFSYAALCNDGRVLASVTARRTRQYPVEFGHSSCFVETVDNPQIEEPSRRLLASMRYTGLVEVEFKADRRDGRLKLLDINPRVWTWHALGRRAGVDFPYLLWLMIHDAPVPELRGRPGCRWVRIGTDLMAAATGMRRGDLSPVSYLRSLTGPLELAAFDPKDPAPTFGRASLLMSSLWNRFAASIEPEVRDSQERPLPRALSSNS